MRPDIRKICRHLFRFLVLAVLVCLTLTVDAAAADTTQIFVKPDGTAPGWFFFLPSASTSNATLVEETTATLNGKVTYDGGEPCQYRFTYGTVSGNHTLDTGWIGSLTTGRTFSANVTGLGKGTKYYFRAQVKNHAGVSSGAELSFLTKPDVPASLTATVISSTQIDLNWTKGEGAQRTLLVRKTGGFPADRSDGSQVYFDTGTSFSDTGLTPETTYYYRAWSYAAGSEQWSDGYLDVSAVTASVLPPTITPPVAVGGVVYPVNKVRVLAPWLFAGSILALVAVCYIVRITLLSNK